MTDGPAPEGAAPLAGRRVAVTGATGFIGGRLAALLRERGAIVRCLVRGPSRAVPDGVEALSLDLADPEAVRASLRGIDTVFHCAFDSGDELWNVGAMRALIAGCRRNGCRRLVHVSSFVVYEIPEHGPLTEEAPPTRATGGYAHLKLLLERELLGAVGRGEVEAAVVQPTIVYGPGSRRWTIDPADMLRHGLVVLPDRGEGICNAVYVDDVVEAMLLAAASPDAPGRRFLVSGPPVTWAAFYEGMARAAGARGPVFRPAEAIRREAAPRRKLVAMLKDPERLVRRIAFLGPVRTVVERVAPRLPGGSGRVLRDRFYGPDTCRPGHVHLPGPDRLRFLEGTATVSAAKARRELGYAPRFAFEEGLVPVASFLRRAAGTG